jgi:hypothetical protein
VWWILNTVPYSHGPPPSPCRPHNATNRFKREKIPFTRPELAKGKVVKNPTVDDFISKCLLHSFEREKKGRKRKKKAHERDFPFSFYFNPLFISVW